MFLTRSSEYAVELVLYLVSNKSDSFAPLKIVAEKTGLSYHFLGKISQILVKAGILTTYRGPNGGVALAKPADQITLYMIVSVIEGESFLNQCMLKPEQCSHDSPCALHPVWEKIRSDVQVVFHTVTMDTFAQDKSLQAKVYSV